MRRWVLTPLVAALFAVSFYESWEALYRAAVAARIPDPRPWPFMVDGFIVAAALLVVEAARQHRGLGVWWPRLGLFAATALSAGIQVAYAPGGGELLAAWSPLAVLFSFECLVWLALGACARVPEDFPEPVVPLDTPPDPGPPTVPTPATVPARPLTPADREALRRVRHDPAKVNQIAVKRGLDRGAVDATVAAWASRNGHHTAGVP